MTSSNEYGFHLDGYIYMAICEENQVDFKALGYNKESLVNMLKGSRDDYILACNILKQILGDHYRNNKAKVKRRSSKVNN